ncbi:TPA: CAP domain-containing protein, partial [Pseudomonas aeruginosa]|nr:CAP domain-containing protein [Pseudomonas aeruginosa]HDP4003423.1 CAP domain-containing protein [Pseudomonas aeruginosa]
MAIPSIPRLAVLTLGLALAAAASAADEAQLVEAINAYRGQVQSCGGQASGELPPLAADPRLALPVNAAGDLQQAMAQAAYPMVNVQSISLSGPRDAGAAMKALQESFCRVVLDPQFVDVGVSRQDRDWRIVLARPLLRGGMGDWQAEGQKLLERINAARGQARQCGGKPYAAAQPLAWNATLGGAAEAHSRAMANGNFFDHLDRDGRTPGDRAELAGYSGGLIGENIAAGQDGVDKVVDGWLASPGHCANLM